MMKRLVYSALAIFCFAVVSCTNEVPMPDYGEDYIVLNVFNSPMTMAEDDATAYERQLKRLDCFFYVKDQTDQPCVHYHRVDIDNQVSATVSFYVNDLLLKEIFPSGSLCDVFVIANLPEEYTFEAKNDKTTMQKLGEIVLDMTKGEYDVIGKPFVMTGGGKVQKSRNSSAKADISLARVASKVTMTVKVPKTLVVKNGNEDVTMLPVLKDNEGNMTLKTSFRYGTNKGKIIGTMPDDPANYIWTDKIAYTLSEETPTSHYVLTCDMPFYTYSRSWEKGSDNAAYVTFQMPWGKDENKDGKVESYETYYYQILVNGTGRKFEPNKHYEMIVTVGVLGSSVEALPKELDELSYYVLDWTTETNNGDVGSGDRDENVEIDKFNYLEVPQTYIEMDNVNTVAIRYNASHKIGVEFNETKGKKVDGLPGTTDLSALYISNYDTTSKSGTPSAKNLEVSRNNFTDNNKGSLTFNYTLSSDVYSPAYVFITIWLDVDGDGVHDKDETLTEDVTIVIYPAIFIVGDNSYDYSIFVNGYYNKNRSSGNNLGYLSINNERVGKAAGDDDNTYMHVISISAFSKDNTFVYLNNQKKQYVIGDPRVRSSNKLGINNDNNNTANVNTANPGNNTNTPGWIKATDVNGTVRNLEYYYPTSAEDNSYQVIAPKFRIASKLGGYSNCSPKGAALRCASYQEHGFPAGRWRLPTTAEILYIIELQRLNKIQQLFYGGNTYFSATDRVTANSDNTYTLKEGIGTDNASVRCVYDEWYWGSEREAIKNSQYDNYGGYQFTWGDRFIY